MNGLKNSAILPRRIIDTNVILRYLLGDIEDQAEKARRLFRDAENGLQILVIPEVVLVETLHVLRKIYGLEKSSIVNAMRNLIRFPGVEPLTPVAVLVRAFENFESVNAPWPDALIAAYAAVALDESEVYSFDAHLDKFAEVKKIEPT